MAQEGKDLLLEISDGADYETVAGLRSRRLAFNAETVNVTDAEVLAAGANCWAAQVCSAPR